MVEFRDAGQKEVCISFRFLSSRKDSPVREGVAEAGEEV